MSARAFPSRWLGCACALAAWLALAPADTRAEEPAEPAEVVALREAWALKTEGKPEKAAKRLRELENTDYAAGAALLRVRWLREAGEADDALELAEKASALDGAAEIRAHLYQELASLRFEKDELDAGALAQTRAWDATRSADFSSQLQLELAQRLEQKTRAEEALALYDGIWRTFPLSPAAVTAWSRAQALRTSFGAAPPPRESVLARADRLRGSYRCDLALPLYEGALADPLVVPPERTRLERYRADCLFERRRYPEAVEAYRALVTKDPTDADAEILLGRSLARSGERTPAIALLTKLSRSKNALVAARARSFLAVLLEDQEPKRYRAELLKLEKQTAAPELAVQARWSLAWADVRADHDARALPRLDALADGPLTDVEVQRARYWRGVLRARSTKELTRQTGEAELRALAEGVPLSYYGMLAAERVGPQPLEKSFLGPRLPGPDAPALRRARVYLDAGFPEIAEDELVSYSDESRRSREERLELARLFHRTGDSNRALSLVQDGFGVALDQGIDPTWRDAWELAWPRAFKESVSGATQEFAFDPALVWAVMREESAYRPEVSSPAGAMGLMQMIPPTAERVAGELGLVGFEPSRLYDPATNIRFGTYYLRQLVAKFSGSRALAIASYNAGPEAVNRWLDRDGALPPDEFVDAVPYGETRRYLRRVLRSYRIYGLLYAEAPPQTQADAGR
jgi:soluble lytic murein transglycosylase